jgi:hypothetical protein
VNPAEHMSVPSEQLAHHSRAARRTPGAPAQSLRRKRCGSRERPPPRAHPGARSGQ